MKEKPIYEQLGYDFDPPFYATTSKPIVTNYDRLISKTPEEMVGWIESIEPAACPWRDDHGDNCRFTHCRDCWLDWLKQEVTDAK